MEANLGPTTRGRRVVDHRQWQRAITDLYDEERRTSLVNYPIWLIALLVISGFLVFLSAGYTDYPGKLWWLLFVWYALVELLITVTVFRHPSLRRIRAIDILLQCVAFVVVVASWLFGLVEAVKHWIVGHPVQAGVVAAGGILLPCVVCYGLMWLMEVWRSMPTWLTLEGIRWVPIFVLHGLGFLGLLIGAQATVQYLQGQAHSPHPIGSPAAFGQVILIFALALGGPALGMIAHLLAYGLVIYRLRVVQNTLRFVGWLFVIAYGTVPALALVNAILWLSRANTLTPFFQPSVTSVVVQILFLVSGWKYAQIAWTQIRGAGTESA